MPQRLLRALRPSARTAKDLFSYRTKSLKSERAEQGAESDNELASPLETEEENMLLYEPDVEECNDLLDIFDDFDDIDDINEEDLQSCENDQDDERLSHSFLSNDSDISMLDVPSTSTGKPPEYGSQSYDYTIDDSNREMLFEQPLSDQISDADELDISDLCPWSGSPFDLLSQDDHEESLFSDDMGLYFSSQSTLADDPEYVVDGF